MSDSKRIGTKFEQEIVDLLKKMDFKDVDGARDNFLIGGVQIDAVAGWDSVLIIFECTTKKSLGKKDLSEKILSFKGKRDLIAKGVAEHQIYKQYKKIWLVMATKNIEIRAVDIELAKSDPRVYIWANDFLEYYAELYSFIKPFAKYDLLGELGIKPISTAPITVPAFRAEVNGSSVYTFLMNPRDLLEVAYVARREKGTEQYYQRIIDQSRLTRIASYVKSGGTFPNNIILAFREDLPVSFEPQSYKGGGSESPQFGLLSFPRDYRSCWIIDGQHRLYAFAGLPSHANFLIPMTAFDKLPLKNQRKYFLDINRNQKPIDPDLLWDLSGDFPNSTEGVISNAVKYLNTHIKSPLRNLIYYPSTGKLSKKGKLKIGALCIALRKNKIANELTLQNVGNLLYDDNAENNYGNIAWALIKYLTVVKEIFPTNWNSGSKGFVLRSGGMTVMIALFERILSRTAELGKLPTPYDYQRYLEPLIAIMESKNPKIQANLRLRATSEAGKTELVNEFALAIRKQVKDSRFGGDIENQTQDRNTKHLDGLLKELIRKYYSDAENPTWLSLYVDEGTYKKALKNSERNLGKADPTKAYFGLTLGECFTLLYNNFERVSEVFINDEDYSFSNRNDFKTASEWIGRMRAKTDAHETGAKIKQGDIDIHKTFMEKMQSCLLTALSSEGTTETNAQTSDLNEEE